MDESGQHTAFATPHLAHTYAAFRPAPPHSLIQAVLQRLNQGRNEVGSDGGDVAQVCVDVGCGSGQNTSLLAPHFTTVVGVDVSLPQLDVARRMHGDVANLSFRVGSAEVMPFETGSVSLVTCCASVHWFNFDTFYKEVDRVLRPGGVLACYSYFGCTPIYKGRHLREPFMELWHELGPHWTEGHNHLLKEYTSLPQLYHDDTHIGSGEGGFSVECEGSLEGVLGYLSSWSAMEKLRLKEGEEAVQDFMDKARKRLLMAAGTEDEQATITRQYNYFLRMWRKSL